MPQSVVREERLHDAPRGSAVAVAECLTFGDPVCEHGSRVNDSFWTGSRGVCGPRLLDGVLYEARRVALVALRLLGLRMDRAISVRDFACGWEIGGWPSIRFVCGVRCQYFSTVSAGVMRFIAISLSTVSDGSTASTGIGRVSRKV